MNDKELNGFIAGVIGGTFGISISLISKHILNFTHNSFVDFAGYMVFGHAPRNTLEFIWAILANILFSGVIGILFAWIMWYVADSKYIIFKAWIFGLTAWFIFFSLILITLSNVVSRNTVQTSISSMINVSLASIILGYVFTKLQKRKIR